MFIMTTDQYKGWYTARKLPHFDAPNTLQFITFRLADALPQSSLRDLREEVRKLPANHQARKQREQIEYWLDQGLGSCALQHNALADVMRTTLHFHHGRRYHLLAWCIMPNHAHVLIEPTFSLPRIIQGWKSYSARWALINGGALAMPLPLGRFWMRGYWDRYIRDQRHLDAAIGYIHHNPVKAGLCERAEDWRWSSAWGGG
jgi:REP element-mobilizing transposase RayT